MNLFVYFLLFLFFLKDQQATTHLLYNHVPVLCYHNITKNAYKQGPLWISEAMLNAQLKTLHDSGYHTIVPDQLYQNLINGRPLPTRPVILSFDDSHEEHYSIARNVLKRYDFKGVFFILTVCIGKKGYMSAAQIKDLSDEGHVIGCHTYDHPFITRLQDKQWAHQIDRPKLLLEKITGRPADYFAYPYGVWNEAAINALKNSGIKAAFQLTGNESQRAPLYSIRRMMVPGNWTGKELIRYCSKVFG
jgi:peptidoglycan/xylan/chitin deacetylase (PgdA/CDA1 family)